MIHFVIILFFIVIMSKVNELILAVRPSMLSFYESYLECHEVPDGYKITILKLKDDESDNEIFEKFKCKHNTDFIAYEGKAKFYGINDVFTALERTLRIGTTQIIIRHK